jgi:hypothetical protein
MGDFDLGFAMGTYWVRDTWVICPDKDHQQNFIAPPWVMTKSPGLLRVVSPRSKTNIDLMKYY